MSRIEKLSIQGVRSFGPDDSKKNVLEFQRPLTLILGPNGTGKTTVIECLKYITTGDFPPGCGSGGPFVHDPKIAGEREVKAQIRLQFRDARGQIYIIQRSLLATQGVSDKTPKLRTLEGLITYKTADGRKESISSKCAELNREMSTLLGVSKAVLENVIFCHQEDSNWPLSEGKALKTKFDDIFASTRYVKALDNIVKFRKEQVGTVRELQAEIKYLKQNKEKAAEIREKLGTSETKYAASKDSVNKVDEKLAPIQAKLEGISEREGKYLQMHTEIEKMKTELKLMERAERELRENISNEFDGSIEELQQLLIEFEEKVMERRNKLQKLESDLATVERKLEHFNEEKSNLLIEHGKLEQEKQQQAQNVRKRDGLIHKLTDDHGLDGYSGRLTDEHTKRFLRDLGDKARYCLDKAKKARSEAEEEEKKVRRNIEKVSATKTKLETERRIKMDTVKSNQNEIRRLTQELNRVDASAERLSTVKQELVEAEQDLASVETAVDVDSLKGELTDLQREKTDLDFKLKHLDTELNRLHQESSTRTQLEMLRKDKNTKSDQIRRLKAKNEESITHLLGSMPSENLRREVENYLNAHSRQIQKDQKQLQSSKMELSSKDMERKTLMEQIAAKEKELKGYEDKIFRECESQNFDEGLDRLEERIKKSRENKGLLVGTRELFTKFVSQLGRDDPPCPLCHRQFDGHDEVDELISELDGRLRLVPDKLERLSSELEDQQAKYDRLQQLKPVRDQISGLKDKQVPELKSRLTEVNGKIESLRNEISELEDDLEIRQSDEQSAKAIQPDLIIIDRLTTEIRDLDRKISTHASKLSGSDSERTVQQVNQEREDIQQKLETINRNLDRKRNKLSEHNESVQRLKSSVNDLRADKLRIDRDLQERNKLEETKSELIATNETINAEIQDAEEALLPLQEQIQELREEKDKITTAKDENYEKDKEEYARIKSSERDVEAIQDNIDKYVRDGREKRLQESEEEMKTVEKKAAAIEEKREELSHNISKIRKDLDTQKSRERELTDNMTLLKKREEREQTSKRLALHREKLGDLDVTRLETEKRKLKEEQRELETEKHRAEGRLRVLEDALKSYRDELRSDQFKDAEKTYTEKNIILRTTELANDDLNKYYQALDRTIMSYHSNKMEEINKIIRDLWRDTYRGHDIDTIEIRSDMDQGATAGKRKVYNYRVVMVKGDTALDMRGRCSAGQKVLASLIIRLALAETFCLNCGILALDEPTTNLDRENIESLAFALVEIIKSRKGQSNFQLVVITHDEDFVELLGRSEFVDYFYKVSKDPEFDLTVEPVVKTTYISRLAA